MGKLDHVLDALADRRLENMDPNDPNTWKMRSRGRKANMQPVGFQIDIGFMQEMLEAHKAEIIECLPKDSGDGNEAVLKRIDQLFMSLVQWVKGMAASMSKLENSVARHTQAVANLKLPKVELEKVEWDLNVKRGPGGLIKKVEARQK